MSENQHTECDLFDYLGDVLWASLPEKSADELADFKKRVLNGIRSAVDTIVDQQINITDRRIENARRIREEWRRKAEGDAPNPA